MGERLRAPRRTSGRRIAALAALAAVLAGGLAAPAYAADPAVRAGLVADDLNGDGRSDVWAADSSDLNVLPAGGAPYVASTAAQSPDGRTWNSFQVSGRGSATGGGTEDLYLFSPGTSTLYLYPNDADSGGRAGYFTKKDQAVKVAKPATCAAGADCTGYDPTWSSATQVVATDGIANKDGMPDLVTVEGGRLWYYPGKAGGCRDRCPGPAGRHRLARHRAARPGQGRWRADPLGQAQAGVRVRAVQLPTGVRRGRAPGGQAPDPGHGLPDGERAACRRRDQPLLHAGRQGRPLCDRPVPLAAPCGRDGPRPRQLPVRPGGGPRSSPGATAPPRSAGGSRPAARWSPRTAGA
ncbi:hypothetical protein GCM10020229_68550 [Kitasatospora albolonga]